MKRPMFFGRDAFRGLVFAMGLSLMAVSCGGNHHESSEADAGRGAVSVVIDAGRGAANAVANCVETCAKQATKCHVACHGTTCSVTCDGDFNACKDSCAHR